MGNFWDTGSTTCFVIGIIVGAVLMPLIGLVFVVDGVSKLTKFGSMYFSKPKDANPEEAKKGPLLLHQLSELSPEINASGVGACAARWTKVRAAAKDTGAVNMTNENRLDPKKDE